jgi:hypothetical protein
MRVTFIVHERIEPRTILEAVWKRNGNGTPAHVFLLDAASRAYDSQAHGFSVIRAYCQLKLRLKLAVLVTAFLISAQNLRAQNLLKNGHFDVDVSGWQTRCSPPCSSITWSSQDANSSPASGSAFVNAISAGGLPEQDIFPVFEGVTYDFGAKARLATGLPGSAKVMVSWFPSGSTADAGCTQGSLRTDETAFLATTDAWGTLSSTSVAPSGARCAALLLFVGSGPGFPGYAYFDDVFFTRQNTTGSFYTVTPCRIFDTRNPAGPFGGPAFAPFSTRTFVIPGSCGIPTDATAIAANLTVTDTTGAGHFVVYPTGTDPPSTSTLNFGKGQTRASNAMLTLGVVGEITLSCTLPFGGTADLIMDVAGYFQ